MEKMVAVIPMRLGSQRVKNKNFKPFAEKTLFEYKVDTIKQLPVDDIIINTDSEYAIEWAVKNGLNYHKREPYYASSECTNSEFHEYLAEVTPAENILIAQVTAPFISKESYLKAIDLFNSSNCNSLMSVRVLKEFLWYQNKPVNYNPENMPNSQDLPEYMYPTFGLVIANRKAMIEARSYICSKPHFMKVSDIEALDIDTELDFEFAQFVFSQRHS